MPLYGHPALWDGFRDLTSAVRAGRSVLPSDAHTRGQKFWEAFARATARDAVPKARAILRLMGPLPRPCEALDLACGSGSYGVTFAREIPRARVTLFDQPHVLAAARKLVQAPVRWLPGDLFKTPFGGPYDVILASHVFHHFDRRQCARLATKIAGALKPGGRLAVQEFVPDERRARKRQPLLFAVTMLVWTRAGDAYSLGDYREWFRAAGLGRISYHPLAMPGDVILARKLT
jgi:C-methyltransferase